LRLKQGLVRSIDFAPGLPKRGALQIAVTSSNDRALRAQQAPVVVMCGAYSVLTTVRLVWRAATPERTMPVVGLRWRQLNRVKVASMDSQPAETFATARPK